MKKLTLNLTGPALAWAVAKAEGRLDSWIRDPQRLDTSILDISIDKNTGLLMAWSSVKNAYEVYEPPENWSQGGPIIEREGIDLYYRSDTKSWSGAIWRDLKGGGQLDHRVPNGPTPLVSAMRCFVTSRLGREIDIPKKLLQ